MPADSAAGRNGAVLGVGAPMGRGPRGDHQPKMPKGGEFDGFFMGDFFNINDFDEFFGGISASKA